jgi:hypothetical protein
MKVASEIDWQIAPWLSSAPLGKPVVPEVNRITPPASCGRSTGSNETPACGAASAANRASPSRSGDERFIDDHARPCRIGPLGADQRILVRLDDRQLALDQVHRAQHFLGDAAAVDRCDDRAQRCDRHGRDDPFPAIDRHHRDDIAHADP